MQDVGCWPIQSGSQMWQSLVDYPSLPPGLFPCCFRYDPVHYGVPEGSYSTAPDGPLRVLEFREMVQALHSLGLRVVLDVVYNHTFASGPYSHNSVLDKIVPGYYHRRQEDGEVCHSTCCNNTASEHRMFERLMIDDLMHWARDYKVGCSLGRLPSRHSSRTAGSQLLNSTVLEPSGCDWIVQPKSGYSQLMLC